MVIHLKRKTEYLREKKTVYQTSPLLHQEIYNNTIQTSMEHDLMASSQNTRKSNTEMNNREKHPQSRTSNQKLH